MNRVVVSILAGVTAAAALAGCSYQPDDRPRSSGDAPHSGGPLSVRAAEGEIGVDAPVDDASWTANFGLHVCLKGKDASSATLESISYQRRSGAGTITTRVLAITAAEVRSGRNGPGSDVGPLAEVPEKYGGSLAAIRGARIANRCSETDRDGEAQIITSLDVGPQGLSVDGFSLDYRVGDQRYRASSTFGLVACGSAQGDACRPTH